MNKNEENLILISKNLKEKVRDIYAIKNYSFLILENGDIIYTD